MESYTEEIQALTRKFVFLFPPQPQNILTKKGEKNTAQYYTSQWGRLVDELPESHSDTMGVNL